MKYRLVLITKNQKSLDKGERFAALIGEILNNQEGYKIEKYPKFDNAYRIEFLGEILDQAKPIESSIELTDRICSPWTVTYKREENVVELLLNTSALTSFRRNEFNVLHWAEFVLENK